VHFLPNIGADIILKHASVFDLFRGFTAKDQDARKGVACMIRYKLYEIATRDFMILRRRLVAQQQRLKDVDFFSILHCIRIAFYFD
jgi:hypothetical protein